MKIVLLSLITAATWSLTGGAKTTHDAPTSLAESLQPQQKAGQSLVFATGTDLSPLHVSVHDKRNLSGAPSEQSKKRGFETLLVPEPSGAALIMTAGIVALLFRRRSL